MTPEEEMHAKALSENVRLRAALEALVMGVEDSVLRFLPSHEVSLRYDMKVLLLARMKHARALLKATKP